MSNLSETFQTLKKQCLESYFSRMNEMQQRAVFTVNGPLLILAGAGSGKTTVLINRILYLIRFGDSYRASFLPDGLCEDDLGFLSESAALLEAGRPVESEERLARLLSFRPVRPWSILAITFTNKAAGELRERLAARIGEAAGDVAASTFHAACVRMLRRDIERLGYTSSFTIYDTDDSLRVIRRQMDILRIPDKNVRPRSLLACISRAKDRMMSPEDLAKEAGDDFLTQLAAKVYAGYQQDLRNANALDFDDIILLTVRLLETCPDVLDYYQRRWRYIMVDEYQDTNPLQYRLVSLLSAGHQNLCVVGDDDQSIYKFRGATIENILSFEEQFPGAAVIRLEQNYRSTQTILDAANRLIEHNTERKGKNLWTQNGAGKKIDVYRASDETAEAAHICDEIAKNARAGEKLASHAILYRQNALSSALERELVRRTIPYRIIGGLRFYERKEIKDAVAYLSVINNPADSLRLGRIINEPKRGIGAATMETASRLAEENGVSLFETLRRAAEFPELTRRAAPLMAFTSLIDSLISDLEDSVPLDEFFDSVLQKTGYLASLGAQKEDEARQENLAELRSNIRRYMDENGGDASLSGFLEEIALYTDIDSYNESDDRVVLMTIHSAKGLEFDHVFLAGMEEGVFPGMQSLYDPGEMEEERRLAYVALTRARKTLCLTCCAQRLRYGQTMRNDRSRFVREIPQELYSFEDATAPVLSSAARRHVPSASAARAADRAVSKTVSAPAKGGAALPLGEGERVEHPVYGPGTVISIKPMASDRLLEIAFDSVGTKKVMANYARLKKI